MIQTVLRLCVGAVVAFVLWSGFGCVAHDRSDTRGYAEGQNRYSDREYRESFRPDVPKMY